MRPPQRLQQTGDTVSPHLAGSPSVPGRWLSRIVPGMAGHLSLRWQAHGRKRVPVSPLPPPALHHRVGGETEAGLCQPTPARVSAPSPHPPVPIRCCRARCVGRRAGCLPKPALPTQVSLFSDPPQPSRSLAMGTVATGSRVMTFSIPQARTAALGMATAPTPPGTGVLVHVPGTGVLIHVPCPAHGPLAPVLGGCSPTAPSPLRCHQYCDVTCPRVFSQLQPPDGQSGGIHPNLGPLLCPGGAAPPAPGRAAAPAPGSPGHWRGRAAGCRHRQGWGLLGGLGRGEMERGDVKGTAGGCEGGAA